MFFRLRSKEFHLPDVVEGCRKHKAQAQKLLVERYYSFAQRLCLRYASSTMEAEEIVDDGFLKVFEKITDYDPERPFEPWFTRIMINTAVDYFRRNSRRVEVSELEEAYHVAGDSNQISQMTAEEILSLVQQLPPVYRMVFNLHALEGYDHLEISKMLGITESTSRANLAKARAKLQLWINQLTESSQTQDTRHVIARF